MDDAELKRVAEAATPGPWDYDAGDFSIFALETFVPLEYTEANAIFIATFDPPTVLSLLSRLSAAEARVGGLEGAINRLRYAISWLDEPFVDETTPLKDIRSRIAFMQADTKQVVAEMNQALTQEPTP